MKYPILIFALVVISCKNSNTQSEEVSILTKKDSLWLKRNAFLSDPTFHNQKYQESEFKKYEGLWTCVKTIQNRDGKTEFPKYIDLLFAEEKAWALDYPCSWNMQTYAEDVYFRNDSIFFSTKDRVYIEKSQIEFRGDTLVIFGDNYGGGSKFYLKKQYDSTVLATLKEKEFNADCFKGKWELVVIGDGASDTWIIKDGYLDHVPRILDFSETEFIVDDMQLISINDTNIKFKILQYDRNFSEYYGEDAFLWIMELEAINGIEYHYSYQPVSN